ncbi:retropepsin-like aspartic protease family protein [Hydrogenophaga flava]|uniref:retropepsin-like aspartic protease family protein n=1 Tax=Hydrogenophaga flava TaxID=65657 RepID=UPI00082586A7|nr:retropepsin-like aspartic protease [Hydrogenophaga flava]
MKPAFHAVSTALLLALLAGQAIAQTSPQVALSGVSGQKALLVVDGAAPKFLAAGQTHQGVKLLSVDGDSATVDIQGQRHVLQVGAAPVSVGKGRSDGGGQRIVLTADSSGHFLPDGQINGKSVKFMVDTGATTVALGAAEAQRINLKYDHGRRIQMSTANGLSTGYLIRLASVRVGDVVAYDVDAVVSPQPMPFVLLGNSFLNRFQMQKNNDQLTLEKRF